jgi:hypothetical protein
MNSGPGLRLLKEAKNDPEQTSDVLFNTLSSSARDAMECASIGIAKRKALC